jgi:hypothetical protein
MKRKNFYIPAFICFSLLMGSWNQGQSQNLVFYFVAPHNVISANFTGALDSTWCPIGYSRVRITSANVARFNTAAPDKIKYVYTQLQPGTTLRTNINLVMRNSQGAVNTVHYWLVDDRTGFPVTTANPGGWFMVYPETGTRYVWPAAGNYMSGGNRVGIVGFGERQLVSDQSQRTGGMSAVDEVVLHETSHTQFISASKWEAVGGNAITYGADGMHYFNSAELLADQEGALNEGLATFYGYVMNDAAWQEQLDVLKSTGQRYFVEGRSFLAGQRELYTVPDRVRDVLSHRRDDGTLVTQRYANGDEIVIFTYRWHSVPGFYVLFAENTSTAFFSIFRNYTYRNKDTAMAMITTSSQAMSPERRKRFLTYACNRLALRMEAYNASAIGRADASRISSIFPFAVLDLLTHFGMTDAEYQADYRRNYADRDPRAYTEYFTRRAAIRTLVQADLGASPIRFNEALQKIVDYCRQAANMF